MSRTVKEIEAEYGGTIVAIVYNDDGTVHDWCFNWQTAQSFALDSGMVVKAIADDGVVTIADQQMLYDAERERYNDCFGRSN